MFDGAGAVGAADAFDHDAEPEQQEAPEQSPEKHEPGSEAPQPLFAPMGMALFGVDEADVKVKDDLGSKGVSIGEKDAKDKDTNVGTGFTITGSGAYSGSITVEGGELSSNGDSGKTIIFENKTAAEIKNILDGLTYKYTDNSEVGYTDKLIITITDDTEDGPGGTSIFTRDINITPENDAPKMDGTKPEGEEYKDQINLKVDEKGSASFEPHKNLKNGEGGADLGVWQKNLGLYDPDNSAEQIIIKITGLPTNGTLTLDGNAVSEGSILSLDQIDKLKYTHNGSQVLPSDPDSIKDSFKITVDDGAGGLITDQVVEIDLFPVNDEPSISGEITIIQGEGKVNLGTGGNLPVINGTRGELTGVDPDDEELTYEITKLPLEGEGVLYINDKIAEIGDTFNSLEDLYYDYPADLEPKDLTTNGIVSFDIKVTDKGGGAGESNAISKTETIEIIVLDNNNDPCFDGVDLDELDEVNGALVIENIDYTEANKDGNTIVITKDMLPLADADSDKGSLVYTVTSDNHQENGSGGYFTITKNGNTYLLATDATFTQADVEAGNVKYHLITSSNSERTDYINFTVKDGAKTIIFDSSHEDGGYARDGGIYDKNESLQEFRLEIIVPEGSEGGEGVLPALPPKAEEINISGNENPFNLNESGEVFIPDTLKADDGINSPPIQIIYRIDTELKHGTLYNGNTALKLHDSFTQKDIDEGKIKYVHDGSENFSDSFHFSLSNGDITTANAFSEFKFDITPQNDSPVATPSDAVVGEGNAVEIKIELTDPDNARAEDKGEYGVNNEVGYRVDSVPAHGWIYLVPEGVIVDELSYLNIDKNTGELDINGVKYQAVIADKVFEHGGLLDKKLIYIHDGSENYKDGSDPINFKITPIDDANVGIWPDGTGTGNAQPGGTNQSSVGEQATINIVVTPRNDAPIFVDKSEPGYDGKDKIYEGESFTIHGAKSYDGEKGKGDATVSDEKYYLVYEDSDSTSNQRQYQVTEAPKYGKLMLGSTVLSKGSVFSQADLDAGRIKYEHDGSENHEDGFNYVVSDGDWTSNENSQGKDDTKTAGDGIFAQGTESISSRYNIKIAPTNDAPEINRTEGDSHIIVDSASDSTSLGNFEITDPDLDDDGVNLAEVDDHFRVTVEAVKKSDDTDANGFLDWVYDNSNNSVTIIPTQDGSLVFEGDRDKVQQFLNDLEVKIKANQDPNEKLIIKVTVDDRIYNPDGSISNDGANGGDKNDIDGTPTDIPSDKYAKTNTDTIEIEVWASAVNDTPEISDNLASSVVVNEDGWNGNNYNNDGRTKLELSTNNDKIEVTDKDAFDTDDNTLTLTVDTGGIYFSQSGSGLPAGTQIVGDGEVGDKTITLKGTKEDLEAALNSIYYKAPKDFNGNDKLTIKYDDGHNIGQDDGDGGKPKSFDEQEVNIHILPVNDTPIIGDLKEQGTGDNPATGGKDIDDDNKYITLNDKYIFSEATGNEITFTDPDRHPNKGGIETGEYEDGHQYADDAAEYTVTIKANIEGEANGFGTIEINNSDDYEKPDDLNIVYENGKMTITGTYDDIHDLLKHGIVYKPADEGAEDKNIEFSITVNDSSDGGIKITDTDASIEGLETDPEATKSFYFQRTDANDAPKFTLKEDSPTFAAHDDVSERESVVLDQNAEVSDQELDLFSKNGGSWDGATLTLERGELNQDGNGYISAANPGDVFGASGDVTFVGDDVKVGDVVVGSLTNANGTLEITFNDNANSDIVNKVLASITYKNTETTDDLNTKYGDNAAVDIIYSMRDGNKNNEQTNGVDPTDTSGTGQNQGTGGQLTGYGKVTVGINRQVVAVEDTNSVTEPNGLDDNSGTVSGDLTSGNKDNSPNFGNNNDIENKDKDGEQNYDPDVKDNIIVESIKVTTENFDGDIDDKEVYGSINVTGKYGTLTINPDGYYTYVVNPENLEVQGLIGDEKLQEVFEYTVNDNQELGHEGYDPNTRSTSTLTITINASNDGVTVDVPKTPNEVELGNIIDPDNPTKPKDNTKNPKDHIVFESGLNGGTNHGKDGAEESIKVESNFTIDALDGLDDDAALTLSVDGKDDVVIKREDLENLSQNPQSIDTEYGTLELKGYDKADDGTITIDYTYTLTKPSPEHNDIADSFDKITIKATDRGGNSGSALPGEGNGVEDGKDTNTQTLKIQIVNDAPIAEADTNEVDEGYTLDVNAENGVLKNDKSGADGWINGAGSGVVGVVKGNSVGTPLTTGANTEIDGEYGKLTLNNDGSYTYVANPDSTDADVQDIFTYTVEDADGDHSTATLTIDVKNITLDSTPASGSVNEKGLSGGTDEGNGHTITDGSLNLPGTQTAIPSSGNTPYGSFVVNENGTYSYTLNTNVDNTSGDVTDTFTYKAKDEKGNTVTNTVTITIVDDAPQLKDDIINLGIINNTSGNVIAGTGDLTDESIDGKDNLGADYENARVNKVEIKDNPGSAQDINEDGSVTIEGTYGKLTIYDNGNYEYEYTHEGVRQDGVKDEFTYYVTDGDSDPVQADIIINIGNQFPEITDGVDDNGKKIITNDTPVKESGLKNIGSNPNPGDVTTEGEINYNFGDGDLGKHKFYVNGDPVNPGDVIQLDYGKVTITGIENGKVTYKYELTKPTSDNTGNTKDKFEFSVEDENGDKVDAIVQIQIENDTPTAKPDTGNVVQGQTTTGNVTSNDKPGADGWDGNNKVTGITGNGDVNPNGDGWTVTTDKGTLTINPNGSYSYTAKDGVGGDDVKDVFEYTITDSDGDTTTAELTINISDNTPPIAEDDYRESVQDRDITGSVIFNDSDPDGDPLTVTTITINGKTYNTPDVGAITVEIPNVGKFIINNKGTYGFIPVPGFTGNVPPIGYTITDGNGGTDKATLFIKYTPGNPEFMPPMPPMPIDPGTPYTGNIDPLGITGGKSIHSSSVTTDPSVFHEDERYDDVRRLPIPLHPILYVNNEVANSQQLRSDADQRVHGEPDMVEPSQPESTSLAMGLGQDHNLFVSHTIRSSAQEAQGLSRQVTGRLSRTDLSADGMLNSGRLYDFGLNKFDRPAETDADEEATNDNSVDAENIENQDENTNVQDEANNETQDLSFLNSINQVQTNGAQLEAENTGSLSFTQQLRQHINRLPIAVNDKISA